MKKILAIVLLVTLSLQSLVVFGMNYDDISANINQINEMISQGLYLEAIQECNQTKAWHNLSQGDIDLLDKLKNDAEWEYNEYQKYAAKYKTCRINDWGMEFTYLKDEYVSSLPIREWDHEYVMLYNPGYSYWYSKSLELASYEVGQLWHDAKMTSPQRFVSEYTKRVKEFADLYYNAHGYKMDVLSECPDTINGFPSYQATYRITKYTNRYKTTAEYYIIKCNIFQHGNWMYAMIAFDNGYEWSPEMWERMELVKNSIRFY